MTARLYRFRDALLVAWCLACLPFLLPSRGWIASACPLVLGIALRAWARRHIGPHSRGRIPSCPERSTGGPYGLFPHPLYLANMLVLAGLASCVAGPRLPALAAALSGPAALYLVLARAESRLVRASSAPVRSRPHDPASGRWRSEWASILPPILLWILALR